MRESGATRPRIEGEPLRIWLVLAAFVASLVLLATRHEMWRDEVRALSVATVAPSWNRLFLDLHHEGHPALWYVVLRLAYGVTHSNLVLPVAAIVVSVITAFLILRYAPFPFWLRLLAVFGAFLGYELSVVARNYGIGVLFMVAACIAFPERGKRPWLPGLFLFLTANTSVHAALASLVLLFIWIADVFDEDSRSRLLKPAGVLSIALVFVGLGLAFGTARPTPDMAWALAPGQLDAGKILKAIFMDPGLGLMGVLDSNVAGAGEFPWRYAGVDAGAASRVIVDSCLLWLAWSLRRRPVHLAAMILSILGFEVLFRVVYSGALRHEGMIAFLLFSIGWLATEVPKPSEQRDTRRQIALGLLPLFLVQSAALPVMARRYLLKPESGAKAYGKFLAAQPKYSDAILMSEPDYLMETMPYYASNRVYMPRQREFHYRVYFDRGQRRALHLTMTQLTQIADSVGCAYRVPVLLALGNTEISWQKTGLVPTMYRPATFSWTEAERADLGRRGTRVFAFPEATSDEIYLVFDIEPNPRCH